MRHPMTIPEFDAADRDAKEILSTSKEVDAVTNMALCYTAMRMRERAVAVALQTLIRFNTECKPDWPKHGFDKEMYSKGDEDAPFFSEAYLYNLLGKEDARTMLAYANSLCRIVAGEDYRTIRKENCVPISGLDRYQTLQKEIDQLARHPGPFPTYKSSEVTRSVETGRWIPKQASSFEARDWCDEANQYEYVRGTLIKPTNGHEQKITS